MTEDDNISPFDMVASQLTKRLEIATRFRPATLGQFESPMNVTAHRHQRKIEQLELLLQMAVIMGKIAKGEPLDPETDFLEIGLVEGLDRQKVIFKFD